MDNKSLKTYFIIIAIVVIIILGIYFIRGNGNGTEDEMQCIAENSVFVVKEGCSACAYQKNLLGEHLDKFEIIDCAYEAQKCVELEIEKVPTWIIKGEKYEGTHLIEELKQLTGC